MVFILVCIQVPLRRVIRTNWLKCLWFRYNAAYSEINSACIPQFGSHFYISVDFSLIDFTIKLLDVGRHGKCLSEMSYQLEWLYFELMWVYKSVSVQKLVLYAKCILEYVFQLKRLLVWVDVCRYIYVVPRAHVRRHVFVQLWQLLSKQLNSA